MFANTGLTNLHTSNSIPHPTRCSFSSVVDMPLPSPLGRRRQLVPMLLPALEEYFHALLTLTNDTTSLGILESSVWVSLQLAVEVVDQLRGRMSLRPLLRSMYIDTGKVWARAGSRLVRINLHLLSITRYELVEDVCTKWRW